jgi:predicted nuclease of predicted toxin-antitoxin system
MKFLADANTPGLLVEALTSLGHEVFWAYTVPRTADVELIQKAARERRVVKQAHAGGRAHTYWLP